MSSIQRASSSVSQGNAYYVNVAVVTDASGSSDFLNIDGSGFAPKGLRSAPNAAGVYQPGSVVVRDLGKTIRVPAQAGPGIGSSNQQQILRKVQRFDAGAATGATWPVSNGFTGFNDGVGGGVDTPSTGFESFYISLLNGKFVRLSM